MITDKSLLKAGFKKNEKYGEISYLLTIKNSSPITFDITIIIKIYHFKNEQFEKLGIELVNDYHHFHLGLAVSNFPDLTINYICKNIRDILTKFSDLLNGIWWHEDLKVGDDSND